MMLVSEAIAKNIEAGLISSAKSILIMRDLLITESDEVEREGLVLKPISDSLKMTQDHTYAMKLKSPLGGFKVTHKIVIPENTLKDDIVEFTGRCDALVKKHYEDQNFTFAVPGVRVKFGKKYAKLISTEDHGHGAGDRGVYCFVNMENGDILKAASWKAPAKHRRGNVRDDHKGMKAVNSYGANYMR